MSQEATKSLRSETHDNFKLCKRFIFHILFLILAIFCLMEHNSVTRFVQYHNNIALKWRYRITFFFFFFFLYSAALVVIHFSGQVSACVSAERLNHKAKITEATETWAETRAHSSFSFGVTDSVDWYCRSAEMQLVYNL